MQVIEYLLHLDTYLGSAIGIFGEWSYVILFMVVFAETGLVLTPFLPGDSLLFAVGALGSQGFLNIGVAYVALLAAAIAGDTANYWAGHLIGPRVFTCEQSRFFKKKYLDATHAFFEKYGSKAIILGRFVPIVRTFVPFVAGVVAMPYPAFVLYNVLGAFSWVTLLMGAGYFFGGLPVVKQNFEWVVLAIVVLSVLPMVVEYMRGRRSKE